MTTTNKLVIMGAGGLGREVHAWLVDVIKKGSCQPTDETIWEIEGFIDDSLNALDSFVGVPRILSTINDYYPQPNTYIVCAIANPAVKKALTEKLISRNVEFFTLIHPSVVVGTNVVIGKGTVICPLSVLTTDLVVGEFVTINLGCTIGHDSELANFCTLSCQCDVTGGARLREGVFLGSRAVVLPNVTIGEYAVVGAGSVAIRKVAPGVTVFGVPAKRISG